MIRYLDATAVAWLLHLSEHRVRSVLVVVMHPAVKSVALFLLAAVQRA